MEKALQGLQAITGRLEAVERQPALRLTPASFKAELDTAAQDAAIRRLFQQHQQHLTAQPFTI